MRRLKLRCKKTEKIFENDERHKKVLKFILE